METLARLERDYLATVNASQINRAALENGAEQDTDRGAAEAEPGYEMLGDDEPMSESEEEGGGDDAPSARGDAAHVHAAEGAPAGAAPSDARMEVAVEEEGGAGAVGGAAAVEEEGGAGAVGGADGAARDIALPDEKRVLIQSLMSGFEIKGAGEWSASFKAGSHLGRNP